MQSICVDFYVRERVKIVVIASDEGFDMPFEAYIKKKHRSQPFHLKKIESNAKTHTFGAI